MAAVEECSSLSGGGVLGSDAIRCLETVFASEPEGAAFPFKDDGEFMLAAVRKDDCSVLGFASERLRGDKSFMLAVVVGETESGVFHYGFEFLTLDNPLRFASDTLRHDKDVVLAAVKKNGFALEVAAEKLQADRSVVLEAVRTHGLALQFASEGLRDDEAVVLAAVRKDGYALQFASQWLRRASNVVWAAEEEIIKARQFAIFPRRGGDRDSPGAGQHWDALRGPVSTEAALYL